MHFLQRRQTVLKLFDLHCDTLYESVSKDKSISDNLHISLDRGKIYRPWVQCFAIWIPDELRNERALDLCKRAYEKLVTEFSDDNDMMICKDGKDLKDAVEDCKCAAIFTVEGGAVLAGNAKNLDYLKKCGVRMITTTWNGQCEFGDGAGVENPVGITEFGRAAVKKMNELDIVVDVSHASDPLFFDIASVTNKPMVASHSNSRTVCNHKRNLTDEQFKVIKSQGGLVGLNFSKIFLNDKKEASKFDIIKHAEYFLSLGGEKTVCLGSDFDGTDIPNDMTGIESMGELYNLFLKQNYSQSLVDDIFFNNAYKFFTEGYSVAI